MEHHMINNVTFSLNMYNIIEAFISKIMVLLLDVFPFIIFQNNFINNPFSLYRLSTI